MVASAIIPAIGAIESKALAASFVSTLVTQPVAASPRPSTVARIGPSDCRSRRARVSSSRVQEMEATATSPRLSRGNDTGRAACTFAVSWVANSGSAPVTGVQPGPASSGATTVSQSIRATGVISRYRWRSCLRTAVLPMPRPPVSTATGGSSRCS